MICIRGQWSVDFSLSCNSNNYNMAGEKDTPQLFSKENYKWMLLGVVVIAAGMILMAGGASNKTPGVFDRAVYSTTRITIAPILILAGLVIEMIAIFRKPKEA